MIELIEIAIPRILKSFTMSGGIMLMPSYTRCLTHFYVLAEIEMVGVLVKVSQNFCRWNERRVHFSLER